jgi:hypothetical protein
MKAVKTALIGAILVMGISSCGNSEPVANYGSSCNKETGAVVRRMIEKQEFMWGLSDGGYPSEEQYEAQWETYSDIRAYVRGLDIPLLETEQNNFVNVSATYLSFFQRYYESGGQDLTLNLYVTPYNDAEQDFLGAFAVMCESGTPSPQTQNGDAYNPSAWEQPYDPYDPLNLEDNRNCSDIGRKVWVGDDDTDNLDADGDGWGCESYGG